MDELIIEKFLDFSPESEGAFHRVEFELPAAAGELEISWSLEGESGVNILDFALEDPDGYRGWSGYSFKPIRLTAEMATPGYLPGPLPSGTWSCRLGLTEIRSSGRVHIEIRALMAVSSGQRHGTWYRGDLHLHSFHSGDGTYSIPEIIGFARERGLQFLALTDHNAQSQNLDIPVSSEVLLIPSMELTTYKGHSNFWNLEARLKSVICESREDVESCMMEAKEAGALINMNHPFAKDRWGWGYDLPFDAVEIWNSRWAESDEQALEWWQNSLCEGRRLCAVGGSDTHQLGGGRDFGFPVTRIRAATLSCGALMEGLLARHVVVAASPDAPWPDIRIGDHRTGDAGRYDAGEGQVLIGNPASGFILRLFSDRGVEREADLDAGRDSYSFSVRKDRLFYRAEIRDTEGALIAAGNPIFNDDSGEETK